MVDFKLITWHVQNWNKLRNLEHGELGYFEVKERESLPRVLREDVEELVAFLIASDPHSAVYDPKLRQKAGSLVLEIVKAL